MQRIILFCESAYQWAREKFASGIEPGIDPERHIANEWDYHRTVDSPGIRRRG